MHLVSHNQTSTISTLSKRSGLSFWYENLFIPLIQSQSPWAVLSPECSDDDLAKSSGGGIKMAKSPTTHKTVKTYVNYVTWAGPPYCTFQFFVKTCYF